MTEEGPSLQLHHELHSSAEKAVFRQRPSLIHLNADTSWLLQLPRPVGTSKRAFFNILIDPWLRGTQSDVALWFSTQWHAIKSSVQSIAELNALLSQTQEGIQDETDGPCSTSSQANLIDAIVVSHEFTDHCHKGTLLELDSSIPVFANLKAVPLIKSWNHFEAVSEFTSFSSKQPDWRANSSPWLPDWISISRIVTESDALYYHSAVMVAFDLSSASRVPGGTAEAVIYSPHGIHAADLRCVGSAKPAIRSLALMHGLHDIRVSIKQLNLGAHNGLRAQRMCRAQYWVSTHDEIKKARGFIAPMLFRKILTLKDALKEEDQELEKRRRGGPGFLHEDGELDVAPEIKFAELKNGESILLQ